MLVTSPPHRLQRLNKKGFTLIELLMVIAVILILAGITFGISRGVQNAQARAKAKAELAILAQSLEQFKSDYGDYPWARGRTNVDANIANNGSRLLLALNGWMDWNYNGGTTPVDMKYRPDFTPPKVQGDTYIDMAKFSYNKEYTANKVPSDLWPLDPWGNPYVYDYYASNTTTWDNFGYLLYSRGPDGTHVAPTDEGLQDQTVAGNIDNIYSGQ